MSNRAIYQVDPSVRRLENQGVASVNDAITDQDQRVLRYELETFVCDGQYEKGMEHILETYLANIDRAQQPAVWVSGFFGSGKSHLVKMLRALWVDTKFKDGATARGIAKLPANVKSVLKELTVQATRHGGVHAASGTLGAGATGSVRLALLRVIFTSVGLPEKYPLARFVMWLKREGIYDQVRGHIEKNGFNWNEELENFYVAEGLRAALVAAKPNLFTSVAVCGETLNNLFPYVQDVSRSDVLSDIQQALTANGKFPLTLVVIDEVQQFIGDSVERAMVIQEVAEQFAQDFSGKVLLVCTGQTAVSGTPSLQRLQARFPIRIELSDSDVDVVVRKVLLAKKPEATASIEQMMQQNLGEISRHLSGTTLGHRQEDIVNFAQDYPILPVRRRFWEHALRVLDRTGTDSQLRNQLSMIHKAIQTNLDKSLGNVIPADYLFFDSIDKLQQSRVLPRKVHEKTLVWMRGSANEQLMARACGLVFLINKLGSGNADLGIHATVDTLADLLIEDLSVGSGALRAKLPGLLDKCELLMKVGEEYRIQTEESAAWNDEFQSQRVILSSSSHSIEVERDSRIRSRFEEIAPRLSLNYGNSKVQRTVSVVFDNQLPNDAVKKICVWIRSGWVVDENSVLMDARQAGLESPTIFVFIPKGSTDEIRGQLIDYKAAVATLDKRGTPGTAEGTEARAFVETIKQAADNKIRELISHAFSSARVFQGGGVEIPGNDLQAMISDGAKNAAGRLYPSFQVADNAGWAKVYQDAYKGAPDALRGISYNGDVDKNPVCKAIYNFIAGGKTGTDIRDHFEEPPFGWSRDAIDGALQVLLVAGLIRAFNDQRQPVAPDKLERKAIGKASFKVEAAVVTVNQRIQIRVLFQKVSVTVDQGNELFGTPKFMQKMNELADQAGGEAPKPTRPDTALLESISSASGNEQLLLLYNHRDDLSRLIDDWTDTAKRITARWSGWVILKRLVEHMKNVPNADVIAAQVKSIEDHRQLLASTDGVAPLVASVSQLLREELNKVKVDWESEWNTGEVRLEQDENWKRLEPEQKHSLRLPRGLVQGAVPMIAVGSTEDILRTLDDVPLVSLKDRVVAMPGRYDQLALEAAKVHEPKAREVSLPRRMLKTDADIDTWVKEVEQSLKTALKNGPIVIK